MQTMRSYKLTPAKESEDMFLIVHAVFLDYEIQPPSIIDYSIQLITKNPV